MAFSHLPHLRGKFNHQYLNSTSTLGCKAPSNMNVRSRVGGPESFYNVSLGYGCEFQKSMPAFLHTKIYRTGHVQKVSSSECNDVANFPDANELVELPLFPLSLVLFPGATIPLQIFEFRYRIMMHTLLQGDLRFGIIYSNNSSGAAADVGCACEIIKYERLVDDRFFIICKGHKRFRVVNVVRTKPYLVAEVQWIEDRRSMNGQQQLDFLAHAVETYLKDVIRLSNKLNGKPEKEQTDLRKNLLPAEFSFFVASSFEGAPREQQELLELKDTTVRLKRERETLKNTLNYLAAASAVKDAFQFSSFNDN